MTPAQVAAAYVDMMARDGYGVALVCMKPQHHDGIAALKALGWRYSDNGGVQWLSLDDGTEENDYTPTTISVVTDRNLVTPYDDLYWAVPTGLWERECVGKNGDPSCLVVPSKLHADYLAQGEAPDWHPELLPEDHHAY